MRREERAGVAAWTGEEERRKEDGKKTGGRYNMITGTTRIPGEREGGAAGTAGTAGTAGAGGTAGTGGNTTTVPCAVSYRACKWGM